MKRLIRDTDIVYSAVRAQGSHHQVLVRLALRPAIDSEPMDAGMFPCRVVYGTNHLKHSHHTSCRSPGEPRSWWGDALTDEDGWLDWLAEGEPGRTKSKRAGRARGGA